MLNRLPDNQGAGQDNLQEKTLGFYDQEVLLLCAVLFSDNLNDIQVRKRVKVSYLGLKCDLFHILIGR
jgi:hypothetical protein